MNRTDRILIIPEVDLHKYFDADEVLPDFATQYMVKEELERQLPGVKVEVADTLRHGIGHLSHTTLPLLHRRNESSSS